MHTHANARLTQKGRLRLIFQHLNDHRPLAELAAEAGISLPCAYKWLARYRSGGPAALADRRSVRRQQMHCAATDLSRHSRAYAAVRVCVAARDQHDCRTADVPVTSGDWQ